MERGNIANQSFEGTPPQQIFQQLRERTSPLAKFQSLSHDIETMSEAQLGKLG